MNEKVLIVDDEPLICELIKSELEENSYVCESVLDGKAALVKLNEDSYDLVLLDIKLPDMSGIYLLGEILQNHPHTPVVMVTGVIDIDTAVLSMKMGASDYIVKPFDLNKLNTSVTRAIYSSFESNKQIVSQQNDVMDELDAISRGVEQRIDHVVGPKIVTERTIQIARQMNIPEEKIKLWKAKRGRMKRTLMNAMSSLARDKNNK